MTWDGMIRDFLSQPRTLEECNEFLGPLGIDPQPSLRAAQEAITDVFYVEMAAFDLHFRS